MVGAECSCGGRSACRLNVPHAATWGGAPWRRRCGQCCLRAHRLHAGAQAPAGNAWGAARRPRQPGPPCGYDARHGAVHPLHRLRAAVGGLAPLQPLQVGGILQVRAWCPVAAAAAGCACGSLAEECPQAASSRTPANLPRAAPPLPLAAPSASGRTGGSTSRTASLPRCRPRTSLRGPAARLLAAPAVCTAPRPRSMAMSAVLLFFASLCLPHYLAG